MDFEINKICHYKIFTPQTNQTLVYQVEMLSKIDKITSERKTEVLYYMLKIYCIIKLPQ